MLDALRAFADMVPAIQANPEAMREAARRGFSTATDLADYLVGLGLVVAGLIGFLIFTVLARAARRRG